MAIEKVIPKDTRQFKPKLIAFFTTRQVLCMIPAVAIGLLLFFGIGDAATTEAKLFSITIFALPLILIGWYEPYGLPFEKFVKTVFISMVLSPKYRKYKTKRLDEDELIAEKAQQQPPPKKKKKKKAVDPELQAYK